MLIKNAIADDKIDRIKALIIFNTTANNEFNITINKKSAINPRQNPSRSFLLRDIWIEILAEIIINIQNLISLKLSATNIEKIVSFPNDSKHILN